MPKVDSTGTATRVVYKNKEKSSDEFVIFANPNMIEKWREDKTIPIIDVVQSFQIFEYHGGHTGHASQPTASQLSTMFDTTDKTEIIKEILENGVIKSFTGDGLQSRGAFGKGGNKEGPASD
ncbi:2146_t:CDS:2 [Acaulospora morrowiae]|uniref:2146_t:CDS:1 n=1 Tax=Acaulospora morrowiae TaxID=94023 RepID=A0A9N9D226_9GLOM|nr:2146_t:CDS:2 [Acaulospora morrowiae]